MTIEQIEGLVAEKVLGIDPASVGHQVLGPAYARDIMAAWSVVEKLRDEGFQFELGECAGDWHAGFDASLLSEESSAIEGLLDDPCISAPLAICLAALATRGIVIDPASIGPEAAAVGMPAVLVWDDGPDVFCLPSHASGRDQVVALTKKVDGVWVLYDPMQTNGPGAGMKEVGAHGSLPDAKRAAHDLLAVPA